MSTSALGPSRLQDEGNSTGGNKPHITDPVPVGNRLTGTARAQSNHLGAHTKNVPHVTGTELVSEPVTLVSLQPSGSEERCWIICQTAHWRKHREPARTQGTTRGNPGNPQQLTGSSLTAPERETRPARTAGNSLRNVLQAAGVIACRGEERRRSRACYWATDQLRLNAGEQLLEQPIFCVYINTHTPPCFASGPQCSSAKEEVQVELPVLSCLCESCGCLRMCCEHVCMHVCACVLGTVLSRAG